MMRSDKAHLFLQSRICLLTFVHGTQISPAMAGSVCRESLAACAAPCGPHQTMSSLQVPRLSLTKTAPSRPHRASLLGKT